MTDNRWLDVRSVNEAAIMISDGPCVCGGMGFVRITGVPVGHPLMGKAIPCPCKQNEMKRARAIKLQERSRLTNRMRERFSFQNFEPGFAVAPDGADAEAVRSTMALALETCKAWARHPRGWLVLSGTRGCGKTHLAIAVASEQLNAARPVYYNTAVGMLDYLRSSYEQNVHTQYVESMKDIDVLVIDDLGAERRTGWTDEQLTDILDSRHLDRKPLLVTTNATGDDGTLPERLASRMREGAAVEGGFVQELVLPAGDARPKVPWWGKS